MIKIFPAIDIINGQCVRLTEGKLSEQTKYTISPLEMAIKYQKAGAKFLHIVDLDAALNQGSNLDIITIICKNTDLEIQVGGGIKSAEQIKSLLNIGVKQVIIGSMAVKNKSLVKSWIKTFGNDRIIIGADTINGHIAINGWKKISNDRIEDFISSYSNIREMGLSPKSETFTFLVTEISRDGKLQGADLDLYKKLQHKFPNIKFIVSGGVSSMEEIQKFNSLNMYAVIVGKAIYEDRIAISKLFKL